MDDTLIMFASKKTLRTLMLNLQNTIIVHGYKNCSKTRIYYSRVTFPLCTGKETRFGFQVSWAYLFFKLCLLDFSAKFSPNSRFQALSSHFIILRPEHHRATLEAKKNLVLSLPDIYSSASRLPDRGALWNKLIHLPHLQGDMSVQPGCGFFITRLLVFLSVISFFCTSYFVQNAAVIASRQNDASLQCVCFAFTTYGLSDVAKLQTLLHAMSQ